MQTFFAESPEYWRKWLELYHSTATEIWLLFWKKHTGKECIEYDSSVEIAICFGWIDSLVKSIDGDSFARKFTPRKGISRWSDVNRERALSMIRSGEITDAGFESIKAARENGMWYLKPVQVGMPAELESLLDDNTEASIFFAELSPSYRKQFMTWVGDGKKVETRIKRAEEAVLHLQKHEKLPLK